MTIRGTGKPIRSAEEKARRRRIKADRKKNGTVRGGTPKRVTHASNPSYAKRRRAGEQIMERYRAG